MNLSNLESSQGSRTSPKRVGRGRGSGLGQTSGKGHKGQLARTGGKVRRGFEGGQSPLSRRMPKRGFNNHNFANEFNALTLDKVLNIFKNEDVISKEALVLKGYCKSTEKVKLIGSKETVVSSSDLLKRQFIFDKISQPVRELIEKSGGSITIL